MDPTLSILNLEFLRFLFEIFLSSLHQRVLPFNDNIQSRDGLHWGAWYVLSKLLEVVSQFNLISACEGISQMVCLFSSGTYFARWSYVSLRWLSMFREGAYLVTFAPYFLPSLRRAYDIDNLRGWSFLHPSKWVLTWPPPIACYIYYSRYAVPWSTLNPAPFSLVT